MRADIKVASKYPKFSRSSLQRLFEKGLVNINGSLAKAAYKLKPADVVTIDDKSLKTVPKKLSLPVIYEDDNVVVIDKPEGVLSHSKGAINEESTVASFIRPKVAPELEGNRAGIVHRLDRGTSGVMIAAKNAETMSYLQKQFSARKTKKQYGAIVEGLPQPAEAVIDIPIIRNPKKPQTFKADAAGKPAQTQFKILKTVYKNDKPYSLIELKPLTGRTHQIRVHMRYIGHPVLGDRVYGTPGEHLYLHAKSLEITLPGGERKVFKAAEPKYFEEFINS